MEQKEYSHMTDQDLLDEWKKLKKSSIINGFIIGFLAGIIFYSVIKNTWGLLTLIPLFFIYRLLNDSRNKKKSALQKLLEERNIKY
ncbi:MAG TPA: hypothetical protein PKX89_06835 [Chitinophagales bacterium]|nr:hypothetical protein [Chitinophagales bacterium]HMX61423.1 hypothetical protein [Chitinophagales bacterium]HMZ34980.1 hypothetical protein [Chitinophagales bacterium]HNA38548.1 hypothetical protein [Chitinophagales bacterium]HNB48419.1 hypothetical protein [Chitinophagales bacterium]